MSVEAKRGLVVLRVFDWSMAGRLKVSLNEANTAVHQVGTLPESSYKRPSFRANERRFFFFILLKIRPYSKVKPTTRPGTVSARTSIRVCVPSLDPDKFVVSSKQDFQYQESD